MPTAAVAATAPHNTDAERTVLGALLIDADAIFQVAAILQPNDFYDTRHQTIYQAMYALMEQGTAIDFITLSNRLQEDGALDRIGGAAFLASIPQDVPTASHVLNYTNIVLEKSRRRQLAGIARRITDLAHQDHKSAEELTETATREFLKLAPPAGDTELTPLTDMRDERYEYYVKRHETDAATDAASVRTGFANLDRKITDLAPGELIVLAGRPGMGKTAFAVNIARTVALEQGKVVAFFSLEMTKQKIFDRLLAQSLAVPAWKLDAGTLTKEEFVGIGPVLDTFKTPKLFISDDANSSLVNIRTKALRHQIQHGLDLLIVDYLQLISVSGHVAREGQVQRITEISKGLKQLARELHCPVLALSQLSRECDRRPDSRPQLADLRDSGASSRTAIRF